MKPRTKLQFKIMELSNRLPMFGTEVDKWAKEKVVSHNGYRTKKFIYCTECGQYFDNTGIKDGKKETCPHCGTRLTITTSKKRTDKEDRFFCVVDRFDEFQVFRYIYILRSNRNGKPAFYFMDEVMQKWMSKDEEVTIVAKSRLMNSAYMFDGWSHSSEMQIRIKRMEYNSFDYEVGVHMTYPVQQWKSEYKKYGIGRQFNDTDPYWLFKAVKHEPKAETLLKARQYSLLGYTTNGNSSFFNRYWPTVKIRMRNKYIVKDASLYADYIQLLERYNKDLHNAFYVCPKNLHKAHDHYVEKRRKEQEKAEKERRERELLKQKEAVEKFLERISKFLDLVIADNKLTITPLKSIDEFKAEGDIMHHCVFTNGYWKRSDCLILSARIGEERIETIEINLKTFEIVQSRGVCNNNTKYHERIIKLVNRNIGLIKQRLAS